MRIDILTLFPNIIEAYIQESIIKRAREKGILDIHVVNIRDYTLKMGKLMIHLMEEVRVWF